MLLRSPTLATITTFYLMILSWTCASVFAVQHSVNDIPHPPPQPPPSANETESHLLCTPFGSCEPCPHESLNEPFCQPFGNRRLMHCVNGSSTVPPAPNTHPLLPQTPKPNHLSPQNHQVRQHQAEGETLAWESCGRIVVQERADFLEFVACNVVFAIVSLVVLFFRSRRVQAMQARHLAARIGLVRGVIGRG